MPPSKMLLTLKIDSDEAVTRIWNLCAGPNRLDLSAGYNGSAGGPLVCDVHRKSDGYRVYLTYRGATSFFGFAAEIVIREINGQAKLVWSIPWQSKRTLRRLVTGSALVIGLTIIFRNWIELSEALPSGLFGRMPVQFAVLAIAGIIFFYTGHKLVFGILYRHRLKEVLHKTFDDVTVSSEPVQYF